MLYHTYNNNSTFNNNISTLKNNDLKNTDLQLLSKERKINVDNNIIVNSINNQTTVKDCENINNKNTIMRKFKVINTEEELVNKIKNLKLNNYKSQSTLYQDYIKLIYAFIRGKYLDYRDFSDSDMKKNEKLDNKLSSLVEQYWTKYRYIYHEIGCYHGVLKNIIYPVLSAKDLKERFNSLVKSYELTSNINTKNSIRNQIITSCFGYYRFKNPSKIDEANDSLKKDTILYGGIKQFIMESVLHKTTKTAKQKNVRDIVQMFKDAIA